MKSIRRIPSLGAALPVLLIAGIGATSAIAAGKKIPTHEDIWLMKRIGAPVLGIYGENDARINSTLPEVTAAMQKAGKTYTTEIFPGTGHGFLHPGREGSDGPQPERAWKRILEFYRARLGK